MRKKRCYSNHYFQSTGVPQGFLLRLLLFSVYMTPLLEVLMETNSAYQIYTVGSLLNISLTKPDKTADIHKKKTVAEIVFHYALPQFFKPKHASKSSSTFNTRLVQQYVCFPSEKNDSKIQRAENMSIREPGIKTKQQCLTIKKNKLTKHRL